ncbi:hypothetical protein NHX12_011108 [Muraenolepis orangiensis]|uniref:Uncharacterized protein n=1 Tax=Muraenolepis orangiensis TaxID=630683 RepID=A0A9Q0DFP8_9TELE|nr:hypothetical protein NHX12_011108 [Muraenolepis orangiensis]
MTACRHAALKENLPSPWRDKETRERPTMDREEALRKSENRRMDLQGHIVNLQRDRHLRAVRLERRWQELAEREGRARRNNQQLLLHFQRAQDTLGDMLEYEMYLQENSPRWHQQLKDTTRAAHNKRMEECLKDSLKRREEEQAASEHRYSSLYPNWALENPRWPQRAASGPGPPATPSSPWLTQPGNLSQVHHQTSPQRGPPPWDAPRTHWSPAWAKAVARSAGTSSADSEVIRTTSATRGKITTKGKESSVSLETESDSTSRCGGLSVQEHGAQKKTRRDLDRPGSRTENSCTTLRVKSQSEVEESSSHMTEDEDHADQSERSRTERGHQEEDSGSVSPKSQRGQAEATGRVGEKPDEVQEDPGETDGDDEHADEDTSSENEEHRLTEEGGDEEESPKVEDDGREEESSDASGEEEGQEQPGASDSESAAVSQDEAEEQKAEELQAEIEDEELEEEKEEVEEEKEEVASGGVDIEKARQGSQARESEDSDSDDIIISPQEHRLSDSDDDEDEDLERLLAPQEETQRKQ